MKSGMKMLALTKLADGGDNRRYRDSSRRDTRYGDMEYETTRNEYNGSEMNYGGVEGRFRDDGRYRGDNEPMRGAYRYDRNYEAENRRGGRRYPRDDKGRFITRGEYGGRDMESYYPYYPMEPYMPSFRGDGYRMEDDRTMNPIGFAVAPSMHDREYRQTADYPAMDEMSYKTSPMMAGQARGARGMKLTHETAEEWMHGLKNEDGTTGPHWSLEQAKQVMAQKGVTGEPLEFWVVMNMLYSDYCKALKKYGMGDKLDLYVDLAKAFIDDKDAGEGKVGKYFEYIVA